MDKLQFFQSSKRNVFYLFFKYLKNQSDNGIVEITELDISNALKPLHTIVFLVIFFFYRENSLLRKKW